MNSAPHFVFLSFRFLEIYPLDVGDKEMSLPLDETALILGTERRRIYDIVNVLESLHFSIRVSLFSFQHASYIQYCRPFSKKKEENDDRLRSFPCFRPI